MIVGIGIDSIEIARFAQWYTYSQKQLLRVFSHEEIAYCLLVTAKSAERFAVRFAAREALFKAYSAWQPDHKIPFLKFCKAVTISKKNDIPFVTIDAQIITANYTILISLTHTTTTATAFAILENSAHL
ncbi:MAG: hypothetical protein AMXMBFR12_01190 [Candidatus Babeliales bacterium]